MATEPDINVSEAALSRRLPQPLPDEPMHWAKAWIDDAVERDVQRNPTCMMLATVSSDGQPSSRVVLCKSFVPDPGFIVFYTNYRSRKVSELGANPAVAATFHWDALGRQIRIEGHAVLSPADESDAYFATRDWGSRLGAWGSDQSMPVESREALMNQLRARAGDLGIRVSEDMQTLAPGRQPPIPRPPHWGGVRIWAGAIELWIEGSDRIHERARWTRSLEPDTSAGFRVGAWTGARLQP